MANQKVEDLARATENRAVVLAAGLGASAVTALTLILMVAAGEAINLAVTVPITLLIGGGLGRLLGGSLGTIWAREIRETVEAELQTRGPEIPAAVAISISVDGLQAGIDEETDLPGLVRRPGRSAYRWGSGG